MAAQPNTQQSRTSAYPRKGGSWPTYLVEALSVSIRQYEIDSEEHKLEAKDNLYLAHSSHRQRRTYPYFSSNERVRVLSICTFELRQNLYLHTNPFQTMKKRSGNLGPSTGSHLTLKKSVRMTSFGGQQLFTAITWNSVADRFRAALLHVPLLALHVRHNRLMPSRSGLWYTCHRPASAESQRQECPAAAE